MASLIVQVGEVRTAGVFHRRVLIGRKPFNGLQIEQRVVSRIHGWIDQAPGGFYIADAKSRGGTKINGERVTGKIMLHDGDEIAIGPATVIFQETDELPPGIKVFAISEQGDNPGFKNPGIILKCDCHAPLWVPASMAGAYGKCAICKGDIVVPGAPLTGVRRPLTPNDSIVDMPAISDSEDQDVADPLGARIPVLREESDQVCSICQSPILGGDPIENCPECSQTYHAECWRENLGCAAYGCAQVNALAPPEPEITEEAPVAAAAAVAADQTSEVRASAPKESFPWDFALLGASVFGAIAGSVTFGVPALAVAALSGVYATRSRTGRTPVATLSAIISVLGVAGGALMSWYWWFDFSLKGLQ
jgi:hypothetical protein